MENTEYRSLKLGDPWSEDYATREAYKAFRTNIMFCGSDKKVIAFTSCLPNEGKSTISMGIARSLSEVGKRVLLIDADMRKSNLQSIWLDETAGEIVGLSQFLSGQASKSEAVYATQYPGFHIMFCGPYPPNPVELLDSDNFRNFIAEVREEYDYVLIDNAPIGPVIDAAVVARACDGVILVMAIGKISARYARTCKAQLEKSGCPILGTVLNHTERRRRAYYKKDGNYYYYHHYEKNSK